MKKLVQFLLILTIFLLGTQVIKLPTIGLSPFQLVVIITGLVGVPFAFSKGLPNKLSLWMAVLWFFSSILAWTMSINPEWAKSYLLLGIMTTALFLIIPCAFSRKDIPRIERWLIRSQYIVIPFSLYTVIVFNAAGFMPNIIPLPGGMSISLGEDALARGTAAGEVRLMLPYATPPVLSIVMAMALTILLFNKDLFKSSIRWSLIIIYGAILIFTGSRSGIMGIVFLLVLLYLKGEFKRYLKNVKPGYLVLGGLFLAVLIIVLMQSEYFQKMIIGRFFGPGRADVSDDRHYLVPLDGLLIWIDSFENLFLGIGFGSSAMMKGAHTYLPPYFLNSFVTLLAERGFMGLILVVIIVFIFIRLFGLRKYLTQDEKALLYSYFVSLASAMFYENFISYYVIFTITFSAMLYDCLIRDIRRQSKLLNQNKVKL